MARRQLDEINAGSMADIAFLLLVFFLVVTTIEKDQGLPRLLPPPVIDIVDPPEFIDRDVYEVLVNLNDELFVEDKKMKISDLRKSAKEFLLSNGDNVLAPCKEDGDEWQESPLRRVKEEHNVDLIRSQIAEKKDQIALLEEEKVKIENADEFDIDAFEKIGDKISDLNEALEAKQAIKYALDYFPNFAALPGSAMISVQNDNSSSYEVYLSVNNELEGALNELRNEICMNKWGVSYDDLDSEVEEDKKKILAIRQIYPQRISEAEPLDIGGY